MVTAESSAALADATDALIRLALAEDVGPGDLSGTWFVPAEATSAALLVARQKLILAGGDAARATFLAVDPQIQVEVLHPEGTALAPGQAILRVQGSTRSLLAAERTALNFLQHLSGVATLTRTFVEAIAHTPARILDTRKTLPGWRLLQKAAVHAGGGVNHRLGLYDMVMVKDNHLAALFTTQGALPTAREALADRVQAFRATHPGVRVEVEADTVEQALAWFSIPGLDVVLLDNMSLADLRACVAARPPGVLLEASGGIHLSTAAAIAETGVDFLSIGALTHSAPAADVGMDFL